MTTVTSWQHHHQRHRPLPDAGDALLSRDPTPATVKPRSRRLSFLRACRRDTPGVARSWRHHLSARARHAMSRHSLGGRMKKESRGKMKKKNKTRVKKRKRTTKMPAYEMHTYEMHACKIHAYEMAVYGMHTL
jgi:hypothetical protein